MKTKNEDPPRLPPRPVVLKETSAVSRHMNRSSPPKLPPRPDKKTKATTSRPKWFDDEESDNDSDRWVSSLATKELKESLPVLEDVLKTGKDLANDGEEEEVNGAAEDDDDDDDDDEVFKNDVFRKTNSEQSRRLASSKLFGTFENEDETKLDDLFVAQPSVLGFEVQEETCAGKDTKSKDLDALFDELDHKFQSVEQDEGRQSILKHPHPLLIDETVEPASSTPGVNDIESYIKQHQVAKSTGKSLFD